MTKTGAAVAKEMVREACLWDVVTKASADFSGSSLYWKYKAYFLDNCTTCNGTYDENCSEEAAKEAALSSPQFKEWKGCWLQYNNPKPTHIIRSAEDDLREQAAANEPWYRKLMIQVNGKQYHGLFDKARPCSFFFFFGFPAASLQFFCAACPRPCTSSLCGARKQRLGASGDGRES